MSSLLRAETNEDHRAAESVVAIDAIHTRAALAGLLLGWHDVWCEVRTAALSGAASPVGRAELLVPSATVVAALGIDLASIGRPVLGLSAGRSSHSELTRLLAEPSSAWGVAYVLLGSRLGNVAIASVLRPQLALPAHCCDAFLSPQVPHLGRDWNAFRGRLDAADLDDDARLEAVAAARTIFRWVGATLGARLATATERAAA